MLTVRGENVLLDMDLARIYGVPTKRLNVVRPAKALSIPASRLIEGVDA